MRSFGKNIFSIFVLSQVVTLSSCNSVNTHKVLSDMSEQHILFKGFSQEGNKLILNFSSCYDVHNIGAFVDVFDSNKVLLREYNFSENISKKKNTDFSVSISLEDSTKISLVRTMSLGGKTYDRVSDNDVIEGKKYFYDFLTPYQETHKIYQTKTVGFKQQVSEASKLANYGPYTFTNWSTEKYNNKKFSTKEIATSNKFIYPMFSYNETTHLVNLLSDNNAYGACLKIRRRFYDNFLFIPIEKAHVDYSGVIYKHSGNNYYIISCAHGMKSDATYESYKDFVIINDKEYDATILNKVESKDLGVLRFESSNSYGVAKIASTSYIPYSYRKLGSIGCPGSSYNKYMFFNYTGHKDCYNAFGYVQDMVNYDNSLGPGSSGGAVFNAAGELIAINTNGEVNKGGYGVPLETFKSYLV